MKLRKDPNICIRIDRDGEQIDRCRERILDTDGSLDQMAQVLALAGNDVRLKILYMLRAEEKLCVCDLSEVLNMKIPAVSQHLRKLKDAQMVYTQREGTIIFYLLSAKTNSFLEPIFNKLPDGVVV